jgi:hypothetical protein
MPFLGPIEMPPFKLRIPFSAESALWSSLRVLDGDFRHPFGIEFDISEILELIATGYFRNARRAALHIDILPEIPSLSSTGAITGGDMAVLGSPRSAAAIASYVDPDLAPPTLKRSAADAGLSSASSSASSVHAMKISGLVDSDDEDDAADAVRGDGGGGGSNAAGQR